MSHNIECKFQTFDGKEVESNAAKKIYILESEGGYPSALIRFDKREYDALNKSENCEIRRNGILFFKGRVSSICFEGDEIEIELTTNVFDDAAPPKKRHEGADLLNKFRDENPDLFTKISKEEFTKIGEKIDSNILEPINDPIDIEENVIDGTLKIEKSNDLPLDELDLEIKGAWIAKHDGDINLSAKIENRFKMAKINTLTPKKLEDSWPQFGDRVSGKAQKATKYTIGRSRLREIETKNMPKITIDSTIPQLKLTKHIYDNKLMISWDYEQYTSETIHMKIMNSLSKKSKKVFAPALGTLDQLNLNLRKNKKKLNINLKNVQEYIESPYERSFFRSKNGNLILNDILKSIGNYIALSMRNIEISFETLETEVLTNLNCSDWIKFKGTNYKITKIEREIDENSSRLKIKARAFCANLAKTNFIDNLDLPKEKAPELHAKDIITDIAIQNEAGRQYEKLLDFISEQKRKGAIHKDNYRSLITKFLNENQTKIQIIAKPLKTEHCEKKFIDHGEIYFCKGIV